MVYIDPISFYILGIVSSVHTIAIAALILSIIALVVWLIIVYVLLEDGTNPFEYTTGEDEDVITFLRGLKVYGYSSLVILSLSLLLLVIVPSPNTYRDMIIAEALQNSEIDNVDEAKEVIDYVMTYGKEVNIEEEE